MPQGIRREDFPVDPDADLKTFDNLLPHARKSGLIKADMSEFFDAWLHFALTAPNFKPSTNRLAMKLRFRQAPGDILWINNLAVMHRRDKYEDSPDPAERRRLYRMWVNLHDVQPVVPEYAALRRGIQGRQPVV